MSSYNDPAKQRSREKLIAFIKKHLVYRRPRDVRVMCFPGAEVEGEEALEVKEVYDKLGIPRKNVVGLEYDKRRAARLRRADLGVQVVEASDLDFFKEAEEPFDIISLDYTGQQTRSSIRSIREIAARGLLKSGGVLCTNYSTNREGRAMQLRYFWRMVSAELMQQSRISIQSIDIEKIEKAWKAIADGDAPEGLDLSQARDAISHETMVALFDGKLARYKESLDLADLPLCYQRIPHFDDLMVRIREEAEKSFENEEVKRLLEILAKTQVFDEGRVGVLSEHPERAPGMVVFHLGKAVESYIKTVTGMDELIRTTLAFALETINLMPPAERAKMLDHSMRQSGVAPETVGLDLKEALGRDDFCKMLPAGFEEFAAVALTATVSWCDNGAYYPTAVERCLYVSNKNVPMHMDMFACSKLETFYQMGRSLLHASPDRTRYELTTISRRNPFLFLFRLVQLVRSWDSLTKGLVNLPSREFLGSSWEPKSRISKENALYLLREGVPADEIAEAYSGFTFRQLAAMKAHITMGTYDKATA